MLFPELTEIVDPEPHGAPLNMAIDEVLLRRIEQPALRIYRWERRVVSFGYFGRVAEAEAFAGHRGLVRRWTGGGIVEHGADLTYTLFVPSSHSWCQARATESYRLVHEAIATFLRTLGRTAEVVPVAGQKKSEACFANPVQFDLTVAGRKLAGAAQRRTRWGLMHQGSIQPTEQLPDGWSSGLAAAFAEQVRPVALSPEVVAEAAALSDTRYATEEWTRRV